MIKIKKSKDKQFYFTVNAKNGKVLLTSETYKRKASVFKGIESLKKLMKNFDYGIVDLTISNK